MMAPPTSRLAYIDWMRGLACVLMFQTHCYDAWLSPPARKGTFYMWLRVPPRMTSQEFSGIMLDKAGIVVPPGNAYGPCGEGFFRMSLCAPVERIAEAFDRMEKNAINFNMAKATVSAG